MIRPVKEGAEKVKVSKVPLVIGLNFLPFLGMVVNGFVNVVITTIERRYGLRSSESGLVAGGYDVASFICLIPISYYGK